MHKPLCGNFLFLLGKYLGIDSLDYIVSVFNFIGNYQSGSQSGCKDLYQQHIRDSVPHLTSTWHGKSFSSWPF